jgi:arylsulfatase A-like enzyme
MAAAGLKTPEEVQGESILPILKDASKSVRDSVYYAYYEIGEHAVPQHYGIRTRTHKLFYLPATQEWQMFDLKKDPQEMNNVYSDPEYATTQKELTAEYDRLRKYYDAPSYAEHAPKPRKKK